MAHNIFIDEGKASVFTYKEPAWHGLGKVLDHPATSAEAISLANLDWDVIKVPIVAFDGKTTHSIHERYATIRKDWYGKPKPFFGIVGRDYRVIQNRDAFDFFDSIVGKGEAIYHTAGALGNGETIWVLAQLPDSIILTHDDKVDKYLLLSNSHDGSSAVNICFTPIRVVCQNTLNFALKKNNTDLIKIRHNQTAKEKLKAAKDLMGLVKQEYSNIEKVYRAMLLYAITQSQYQKYIASIFPILKNLHNDKSKKTDRDLYEMLIWLFYHGKGNQEAYSSLWAAYNSITEYIDYYKYSKAAQNSRLNSVWYGDGAAIKKRAFEVAVKLMKR